MDDPRGQGAREGANKLSNSTKRVAYLVNEYPRVSHTFIRREILSLEAHGVRICRYSIRGWDRRLTDPADEEERTKTRFVLREGILSLLGAGIRVALSRPLRFFAAGLRTVRSGGLSPRTLFKHGAYLLEACLLLRWTREDGVEHLHAHFGSNPAAVALILRQLGGPPYSFTIHGQEEVYAGGLTEKTEGAAFVATVSSFGRSQVYLNIPPALWSRVQVVRCGLDDSWFAPAETEATSGPGLQIFCLGRLCKEKGQHILLSALKVAQESGETGIEVCFGGDGELRASLEEVTDKLGLSDRVSFAGALSAAEVRSHILRCDCLVLPSFSEGLPVAIMEAMALGKPVISTYVGGIPELIEPGRSGWLVPAGSATELAEAIRQAAAMQPEDLATMGLAARSRVEELHRIEASAEQLLRLFATQRA